ncbi:HDOD domain-containing protein [Clostridium sp. SHJSY1]|uniref:EAL and HDOD domain-containing protein n=1 Tax=Clostridium sp. SHJSY1 TaxID=2942483 RepID=UPI002876CA70|nr:HDOD domain-containing protein [Clostridium sp. SHJSY1]MDS0525128.1 HDOD domain-containing protein [Clostridium sp. SHJSY1]
MDVYVARQAILDVNKEVVAYELLFRNSNNNKFNHVENTNPTLEVIRNSFSVIGLEKVTEGKRAFINFDGELINSGFIEAFPKDSIAIEILESVEPDERIIESCKVLKEKGYVIALDDFCYTEEFDELIEYVDIIKVDFILTKGKERKEIIEKIKNEKIKFLAEKVETEEEFKEAIEYGYSYFQGYFFCKPVIIEGKDISGYKFTYMSLINELNKDNVDIRKIENLIKNDVSLSYKLLKAANSAHFSLKRKITSIGDAIIIIGIKELKKWLFIITLQNMGESKIGELVKMSLIRAFFGELLSYKIKEEVSSFDAFITGMFSLIDALMNIPIEKVLGDLPVSNDVREALLKKDNTLSEILKLIVEYENGNWEEVNRLVGKFGLDERFVRECYLEAIISIDGIEGQ